MCICKTIETINFINDPGLLQTILQQTPHSSVKQNHEFHLFEAQFMIIGYIAKIASKNLSIYSESQLGEWLSRITSISLVQTMKLVGMKWRTYGKDNPVILFEYPTLDELR